HLVDYSGYWRDSNTSEWKGGKERIYTPSLPKAPTASANFFTAVETKMIEAQKYVTACSAAAKDLVPVSASEAKFTKEWREAGEYLGKLKDGCEKVKKYLWFAPDGVKDIAGNVASFADVLGKVKTTLDRYQQYKQIQIPENFRIAFTAMEVLVGYMPGLG